MKLEAKIGMFLVLGISALFILSTQVTNMSSFSDDGYHVSSYIDDATGLDVHSKVLMNGVKIGEVSDVLIEGRRVKIILTIDKGVKIAQDSTMYITQESVLGAKTINLVSGTSTKDLDENGEITKFHSYAAFDQTSDSVDSAAKEMKYLMQDLRDVVSNVEGEELKRLIATFNRVGDNLDGMLLENRKELRDTIESVHTLSEKYIITADSINSDLPSILKEIKSITKRLNTLSDTLDNKVPKAVDNFIKIEDNVSAIVVENRKGIRDAIDSANVLLEGADETFTKVDDLLSSFTQSELQVGMTINYMTNDSNLKSYANIAYLPNPETYYLLDIVSMTDYSKSDSNGKYVPTKIHDNSKFLFSGQYAKRFDNLLVRGGIIESTGGLGIDYYMYNDKFKVGMELYDFNAVNDLRATNPHMTLAMRYKFLKHLELHAGYDNFLNKNSQNLYLGLGVSFIDNNFKYILGSASMMK